MPKPEEISCEPRLHGVEGRRGGAGSGDSVTRRATWRGHVAQTDPFFRLSSPHRRARGRGRGGGGVEGRNEVLDSPPGRGVSRVGEGETVNRDDDVYDRFRCRGSSSLIKARLIRR
jgi:hypothetical protein